VRASACGALLCVGACEPRAEGPLAPEGGVAQTRASAVAPVALPETRPLTLADTAPTRPGDVDYAEADEHAVRMLPIAGPMADADSEISGLAWYGDQLVFVPETLGLVMGLDRKLRPGEQVVYALTLDEVVAAVDGTADGPLVPRAVPVTPGIVGQIEGIDGFEAVAFAGDRAFFQIETFDADGGKNPSIIMPAKVVGPGLSGIELDLDALHRYARETGDTNASHEAMFVHGDEVCAIYELNSAFCVDRPAASCFDHDLRAVERLAFPHIDYRITDVTALAEDGTFWAINYRYPGSKGREAYVPAIEALCRRFGIGPTHKRFGQVERLVQLQVVAGAIELTDRPPLQLELAEAPRNWEGIARLPGRGLLIVTDRFPGTLFGFVAVPDP
jgi:hypothetical protein